MGKSLRILNLYAGIGGNRKLWGDNHEIVAVEYDQATADVYRQYFPNDEVVVADAHQYLLDHFKEFDFIWASPPCPTHSDIRRCGVHAGQYVALYPAMELYQEITLLKHFAPEETKYCIENVKPYYEPWIKPDVVIHRHFYWCNFDIPRFAVIDDRKHQNISASSEVYGFDVTDSNIDDKRKALRNMVDPDIGRHILNAAMNVQLPMNIGLFHEC